MRTISLALATINLLLVAGFPCRGQSPQPSSALERAATIAYYPSLRKLAVDLVDAAAIGTAKEAGVEVRRKDDARPVVQGKFPLSPRGGQVVLDLPTLADGAYEVHLSLPGGPTAVKRFKHKNYSWLGNDLGKSRSVYPPFQPVKVEGRAADVVLRTYVMNGFGLWDSVKSQGKEILAAPIRLRVETAAGEQDWRFAGGQWTTHEPWRAVYESVAATPAVEVRTKSSLEYDGCMKVEMDLLPGKHAAPIRRMWLEIPLRDQEAPLFHYCAMDGMRRNYAGRTPRGGRIVWGPQPTQGWLPPLWKAEPGGDDGLLWTCRDIRPNQANVIPTNFVPYIWLGGGERGLAFFAANDKGYLLDPKGQVQTIERCKGVLYLRVDLVNKTSNITASRRLVFGLQASPTRPMPDGWRGNPNLPPPHGGPVVCWGGYHCADKYPDGRNFAIVDAIQQIRKSGVVDMPAFESFDKARAEPGKRMWADGAEPWLGGSLKYFIGVAQGASKRPGAILETYVEEHRSDVTQEEWEVYQDEWRAFWPWTKGRTEITGPQPMPNNNESLGQQHFPASYRDFCLYYDHEWMKRGVGLYFDNTMPYYCQNPLTSEAFLDESGKIHPAATIWEQREYYQRVWTLMNELMANGRSPFPLGFTQHVTNTCVLPLNTWNTASLDLEWRWYDEGQWKWGATANPIPFPVDLLLAETTGRQTGSYGHALFDVNSRWNASQSRLEWGRTEWGMRIVHEILRQEPFAQHAIANRFEKALRDFGYGSKDCEVVDYWSDDPPVSVSDENTKWLLVKRKKDKSLFLVLQTWNKATTEVAVKIDTGRLGFTPAGGVWDVETNAKVPVASAVDFRVSLAGPYGTRVLKVHAGAGRDQ